MLTNSKLNRVTETPKINISAEHVQNPWRDDGKGNGSNIFIGDRNSTCNISNLIFQGNVSSAYGDKAANRTNHMNTAMIAST